MTHAGASQLLADILENAARARDAATQLRQRPVEEIVASLDRCVARFLDPGDVLRQRAEAELPAVTGFSPPMIRHGLPSLLEPLRGPAILDLLDAELGDHRVLDATSGTQSASGPGLMVHVLSGNIPALAAAPVLLSLALKSPVIVKPAAGDPLFPALLRAALVEIDPLLAQCVVVAAWRGGDAAVEAEVFRIADLVVASGSDAAIAAIRARVGGRYIGHGHKVSFAAIARECLSDDAAAQGLARRLAYDVSLWDQQGCLSPQLCYVEDGAAISAVRFAGHLASALSVCAQDLPPRQLDFEDKAAILRFRQAAEWNSERSLLASSDSNWSLSLEAGGAFEPTCLNRCLRVKVVDDLAGVGQELARHRRHLEAVGLAADRERRDSLALMFARHGVHRVCQLGTMQRPSLSWRQGGRPRVADWIEWAVVEGAPA